MQIFDLNKNLEQEHASDLIQRPKPKSVIEHEQVLVPDQT